MPFLRTVAACRAAAVTPMCAMRLAVALLLASGHASAAPAPRPTQTASAPSAVQSGFDAARQRADEARAAGRDAEALEWYQRAVTLRPSWTEGYWLLGTMYYDADRHRECRDAFATLVRTQPDYAGAWAFRGLCEFQLAEYSAASAHLARADDLGLSDYKELQSIVAYHRSLLLARAGSFEQALDIQVGLLRGGNTGADIQQALGISMLRLPLLPGEVPRAKRRVVDLAGHAGAAALSMTKNEAEPAFRELVAAFPDEPNVHYLFGTYLARDRPDEALAEFEAELRRSPGHVLARVQIALEFIKRNEFERAAAYAADAARLGPRNFLARKVLGQTELHAGRVPRAIAELEAARSLEPTSPSVRFHLARAYQSAGRIEDAARERAEFSRLEAIEQKRRGGVAALEEDTPR